MAGANAPFQTPHGDYDALRQLMRAETLAKKKVRVKRAMDWLAAADWDFNANGDVCLMEKYWRNIHRRNTQYNAPPQRMHVPHRGVGTN